MSDPLSATLERLASAKEEMSAAEQVARAQEERAEAARVCSKLSALRGNADMAWFLETILRPKVQIEHDAALDPKNGKDACWDHVQRHAIAKEMADALEVEYALAQATFDALRRQE